MKLELAGVAFLAAVMLGVLNTDQGASRNLDLRLAGLEAPAPIPVQARGSSDAMPICASKADILTYLDKEYGQVPVLAWLDSARGMLTFLGRPDGTSSSLVLSDPAGVTCVVDSGHAWRPLAQQAEEGPGA